MLKQYCPDYTWRIVFTNNFPIGSFFNIKDKISDTLCSHVVYRFSCPTCKSGYIGSASRNLKIRKCEHKGTSYRTQRQLMTPTISNIRSHSLKYDHAYGRNSTKILFKARDTFELRLAESLSIHKNRPTLNDHETAVQLQLLP